MKLNKLINKIEKEKQDKICKICQNTGYFKTDKGIVRFCPDCLQKRGEEQHG